MTDETTIAEGPMRIPLTGGKEVELRELDAIELLQAVSYAGETPSGAIVNMTVNICSICKVKRGDGSWADVYPLRSKAEFLALGKTLSASDVVVLGATIGARAMAAMSDDQKKALEATLDATEDGSSPTP